MSLCIDLAATLGLDSKRYQGSPTTVSSFHDLEVLSRPNPGIHKGLVIKLRVA